MKKLRCIIITLFSILAIPTLVLATPIVFNTSTDFALTVTGISDYDGNPLISIPSELAITGDIWFAFVDYVSLTGTNNFGNGIVSANVISGGTPVVGTDPIPFVSFGDGICFQTAAFGTVIDPGSVIIGAQAAAVIDVQNHSSSNSYYLDFQAVSTITNTGSIEGSYCFFDDYKTIIKRQGSFAFDVDDSIIDGIPHTRSQSFSVLFAPGAEGGVGVGIGAYGGGTCPVPEPGTMLLFGSCIIAFLGFRRKFEINDYISRFAL